MVTGKPGIVRPERYRNALGKRDPLKSSAGSPARVARLIRGLSEKQLSKRPAPGKWSIKEVIAHLADGEVIIGSRLRFVAAQDKPPIPGYDQDAFVENLGIEKVPTKQLLREFAAARQLNVSLLKRIPKRAFKNIGIHSERGEESIEKMLWTYAGHDIVHEEQIQNLRARLGGK